MIKQVVDETVGSLLSDKNIYVIPKYQREYTWGKRQWENLFYDILENEEGYFLGSILSITSSDDTGKYEIIDGQQRLTTISLLLCALYYNIGQYRETVINDEDFQSEFSNLKKEMVYIERRGIKNHKETVRLNLQVQNNNQEDYLSLLYEKGLVKLETMKPKFAGLRRIFSAFNYFDGQLKDLIKDCSTDTSKVMVLLEYMDKLNHAIIVNIKVDSHKNAYMLFESLNNRGIPLSSVDLIKNMLISEFDKKGLAEEAYNHWKSILSRLGDNTADQERFFRYYYNAFRKDLNDLFQDRNDKKYHLGSIATKSKLLDIYEKLIKKDPKAFLENIGKVSKSYSILIDCENSEKIYAKTLIDLKHIQGTPSYILLMFLLEKRHALQISDVEMKRVVQLMVRFFVRRNITDTPSTNSLIQIFMKLIENIEEKNLRGDDVVKEIKNTILEVAPSDEVFREKLNGALYLENDMATRFILSSIEAQHQTKEIYTDFWQKNNSNIYIWTIEHIFPEGKNIPSYWVDMIADGDKEKAEQYREKYVHKLGNLTLTGYNPQLSNMSFERKKFRKSKDKEKEIGYNNGLWLNRELMNTDVWTVEKIENRTKELVDIVMVLYKLDEE